MRKRWLIGVIVVLGLLSSAAVGLYLYKTPNTKDAVDVRIGYFHGARTLLLLRAHIAGQFEKQGVSMRLLTRMFKDGAYVDIPKDPAVAAERPELGAVPDSELLDRIMRGELDGATVGDGSFVVAVAKGMPLVAVAELGHDSADAPASALVLRRDVVIEKPSDFVGKKLGTRGAGPTDAVIMREFLASIGVSPEDVQLQDHLPEGALINRIARKGLDGGYLYSRSLERLLNEKEDSAYVYRKFDWIDPELSHALLVFRQDFVDAYPEEVEKVVRGYMNQIRYERGLSKEERLRDPGPETRGIVQIEMDFMGLNLPQYDLVPTVSASLLDELQELLFKYKFINIKTDLSSHIDNSFVEKISTEVSGR